MNLLDWAVRIIEGDTPDHEPIELHPEREDGSEEHDSPAGEESLELHQPEPLPALIATPAYNKGVPTDHLSYYIDRLKKGHLVLLNLSHVKERDVERARRIVDQMEGACLALDGKVHDVAEDIFLFAPPRAEIEIDDHTQMV